MTNRHPDIHPGMTIRLTLCERDAVELYSIKWIVTVYTILLTIISRE